MGFEAEYDEARTARTALNPNPSGRPGSPGCSQLRLGFWGLADGMPLSRYDLDGGDLTMGLLFADQPPRCSPQERLHVLFSVLRSETRTIAHTQQAIRQLLADHPELEHHVANDMKKKPRLVVDNAPHRNHDDGEGPDAA